MVLPTMVRNGGDVNPACAMPSINMKQPTLSCHYGIFLGVELLLDLSLEHFYITLIIENYYYSETIPLVHSFTLQLSQSELSC